MKFALAALSLIAGASAFSVGPYVSNGAVSTSKNNLNTNSIAFAGLSKT